MQQSPIIRCDESLDIVSLNKIARLRELANCELGRSRICFHQADSDATHEMLIYLTRSTVIEVHQHINKHETFICLYGRIKLFVYESNSMVAKNELLIGSYEDFLAGSVETFMYRLNDPISHKHVVESDYAVVFEVTDGPFEPATLK